MADNQISILINDLRKGLSSVLNGNYLTYSLIDHFQSGKKIIDSITLAGYIEPGVAKIPDVYRAHATEEFSDLRFRRLLLKGIRKFPSTANEFYFIDFGGKEGCRPSVFLGSNGIGKSSLFAALEYATLPSVSTAINRGYKSKDEQREFMLYHNEDANNAIIYLDSSDSFISASLNNDSNSSLSYPAFFCMDEDIYRMSRGITGNYIAEQLGIKDYYSLLNAFKELSDKYEKYKERYHLGKLEIENIETKLLILQYFLSLPSEKLMLLHETIFNRIKEYPEDEIEFIKKILFDLSEILNAGSSTSVKLFDRILSHFGMTINQMNSLKIDTLSDEDGNVNILEQLLSIREFIWPLFTTLISVEDGKTVINYELISDLTEAKLRQSLLIEGIEKSCPLCRFFPKFEDSFSNLYNYIRNRYRGIIENTVNIAQDIFSIILKEYFSEDIDDLSLETANDGESLQIVVKAISPLDHKSIGEVNPRKYLNTFRFKLFCVALKFSLAVCCMKIHNMNFPFIMDDVFDSSDFSNREKIRDFITHLYSAHQKIIGADKPLQLIFFTQDNIIGDSVYQGIDDFDSCDRPKYSRIFSYTDIEENEVSEENLPMIGNIRIKPIEDTIRISR